MPNSLPVNPLYSIAYAIMLALGLSACNPLGSTDTSSSNKDWSCQSYDKPFSYSACQIDAGALITDNYSLQLFWQDEDKQTLLSFDKVMSSLPNSQSLLFAMNAGMYNQSYAPIGYTVIAGEEKRALNLKEGGGNFHLLPNGVMWWDKSGKVQITESHKLNEQIKSAQAKPWYATQSGPMLVINGVIHPEFNPNSRSLKFRNGAGVCHDGSLQFVNSDEPVSFYQFAALFKDGLGCDNALFLDGGIASSLYAPSIDKDDKKEMGVIIGALRLKD